MDYLLTLIGKNFGMKINKLLGIVVLGLLLSENGYTESVDFAVNISEPGSISSILGNAKQIKIADNSIFSTDKTTCITNVKDLNVETFTLLKLID